MHSLPNKELTHAARCPTKRRHAALILPRKPQKANTVQFMTNQCEFCFCVVAVFSLLASDRRVFQVTAEV